MPTSFLPLRTRFMRCLPMLLGAVLVACSSHPQKQEAGPRLPERFSESGQGVRPAQWWTAFDDAQLSALINEALEGNADIAAVAARLRASQASARAAGAPLLPSVEFELTHQDISRRQSFVQGELRQASLGASYELDLWGRIRSTADAARYQVQATEQERRAAQVSLSANVAVTWFRVGTLASQLERIEQERATYERVLKLVESRFRHGQAAVSEVLRQRQLIESTDALRAANEAELAVARHALEALLGKVAGSGRYLGAEPDEVPSLPAFGVPAEVLQRRPDVESAWLQVRAADADVAAAISNRFPRISLAYTYGGDDAGGVGLFEDWMDTLVASLVLPIIDGGARRAEVDRTRAVLEQRLAEYRGSVLVAIREVEDALVRLAKSGEQLASLEAQAELSEQVVSRLERQLRNGSVEYLDLLDAQITDSGLRRQILDARQARVEQYIELMRATAGPIIESEPSPPGQAPVAELRSLRSAPT